MNSEEQLARAFRTNRIIGFGLVGSLLVYALIVEVLKLQEVALNAFPDQVLDTLRFIFVFFAFAAYFIIKYVRKILLAKHPGDSPANLLGRLTLVNILSLTLAELPAILGLILFLGSGNSKDFYLLGMISLILFYVFFPNYTFWAYWTKAIDTRVSSL